MSSSSWKVTVHTTTGDQLSDVLPSGTLHVLNVEDGSERLGSPAPVPRAVRRSTGAAVFVSGNPPARAARHGREERDRRRSLGAPGKAEHSLFERRKKGAEGIPTELREVFQDEDPSVTEINLAWPLAEAEKSPRRACGVGEADRREVQVGTKLACPGVGGVDLAGLVTHEVWQEAGQRADDASLPGSCGTNEEEMMPAAERDFQRALSAFVCGKIGDAFDHA